MMTEQLRVSVVAAPLAAIDPRALSQAWYSALHAARPPVHRASVDRPRAPLRSELPHVPELPATRERRNEAVAARARSRGVARADVSNDERVARASSRMARRIERALVRQQRLPHRASFVVGEGGTRTLVALQTRGGKAHLVAMCAPERRATVVRALAQVRASLAARGLTLESRVRASLQCS